MILYSRHSLIAFILPAVLMLAGCAHPRWSRPRARPHLPPLVQASANAPPEDLVTDAQKKGVLGRPESLSQVRQVATRVRPILDRAINQPEIQRMVKLNSAAARLPVDRFKAFFVDKQEADILLESGGDFNAVSPAGASGVAQWLISTGRGRGALHIDARESRALTAEIDALQTDIGLLRSAPASYTETWPPGPLSPPAPPTDVTPATPSADGSPSRSPSAGGASSVGAPRAAELPAPDAPVSLQHRLRLTGDAKPRTWERDELIAARRLQVRQLEARRMAVDERFNPELALFAQTRYLMWMWSRYPSLDWVFEAYHGGEKGVEKTVDTYLGRPRGGARLAQSAIRGESDDGAGLSYSHVFFTTTPRSHPEAFSYLYGLKDEHRLYWFKLLMAQRALQWFRRDPKGLANECAALRPGYRIEDAWYPAVEDDLLQDVDAVQTARSRGILVDVPPVPTQGLSLAQPPEISAQPAIPAVTRPETLGALKQVVQVYRKESLKPQTIEVVALTQPVDLVRRLRARYPLPAPRTPIAPGLPSPGSLPDFHAAGLAADILKPRDPWEAKVLYYALCYWEDRERIHFNTETWGAIQAWRIIPNPLCRHELVQAARG